MKNLRIITSVIMVLALLLAFAAPCVLADEDDNESGITSEGSSEESFSGEESVSGEQSDEESSAEESSVEESSEESSVEPVKEKYVVSIKTMNGGEYSISDNYVGESHDRIEGISSYTFFEGDTVTFSFTPDKGKVLKNVKAGTEELTVSDNKVSFVVESDVTVYYEFDSALICRVSLSTHFLCDSTGFSFLLDGEPISGTMLGKYFKVYSGTSSVFTVVSENNPDFKIKQAELRVNGESVGCEINGDSVVIPPVYETSTFYIEISGPFFSVDLVQTEHGTVSCSKTVADENEEVTFTFAPEEGYKAKYIVIDNNAIPVNGNSYVAVAVSDLTVSVVFGEDDNEAIVNLKVEEDEEGNKHGSACFENAEEDTVSITKGDTVTVAATPDTGYEISSIKVNGISYPVDEEGKLKVVITRDTEITVSFKMLQPRITAVVTNAGGGSITAVDKKITMNYVYVNYGESITFNFTPDMHYQISFVKVDLSTVYNSANGGEPLTSYTFENVTENHTIAVSFAPEGQLLTEFKISSTASENGTITPLGEQKVVQGENVSYKITPNEGYEIDYVTVDGKDVSLRNGIYTFEAVSEDHIISAYFKEKSVSDQTLVTVDDINWTTSSVVIDITEKTEISNKVIEKLAAECAGRTAIFKAADYEVSFVVPGTISADQLRIDLASRKDEECTNYQTVSTILQSKAQYSDSVYTMITLSKLFPSGATAKVKLGDKFAGKKLSYMTYEAGELVPSTTSDVICGTDGWAEVTLRNYKDLVFVAESSEASTFNITINAARNGKVEPSGTFVINNGEAVQFVVEPDEGYAVSKILVNGESVPVSGTKYKITPVEDTEIEIRFALKQQTNSSNAGLIICMVIILVAIIGGVVLFIIKWKQTKY